MKNIKISLAVVFMLITSIVMAQDGKIDTRGNFQFGLKAGLNYSNVYNSDTEEFSADAKFGFAGGIVFGIPISNYIGIQPEILFSQKGFKGEGQLLGSEYKFTRTTSYIDIPIQIAFNPSEFITILAGPQYSYLLSQKDDFTSSSLSYSQEEEFDNDNIRKNILGIVAGIDINIKHVLLGVRMAWDIQNNHGDGSSNTPQYKNTWVQGTIGYNF